MEYQQDKFSVLDKALAWSVHLFTASGILAGFMAILAIQVHDWRRAMLWLILALIIDGVDGTLARRFRVVEVLPFMNGKTIDYVVDFATYAIIPAYFFYETALVNESWRLISTFLILMTSAIYYGKEGMVSDDNYFIGFPVLWNIVVFYMVFVFHLPDWANLLVILLFSILHFVPIKFPYPSQQAQWREVTWAMAALFGISMLGVVWIYPEENMILTVISVLSGVYFMGAGFLLKR